MGIFLEYVLILGGIQLRAGPFARGLDMFAMTSKSFSISQWVAKTNLDPSHGDCIFFWGRYSGLLLGAALQAKGAWPSDCATCQSTLERRKLGHSELIAGLAAVRQQVDKDLKILETQGRVPVQGRSLLSFGKSLLELMGLKSCCRSFPIVR